MGAEVMKSKHLYAIVEGKYCQLIWFVANNYLRFFNAGEDEIQIELRILPLDESNVEGLRVAFDECNMNNPDS